MWIVVRFHSPTGLTIFFSLLVFLILGPGFCAERAYAADEQIIIGREDNWQDLAYTENIRILKGKGGYLDVFLSNNGYDTEVDTDLLLDFDFESRDSAGNYTSNPLSSEILTYTAAQAVHGDAAGVFHGRPDGLLLIPSDASFLGTKGIKRDFTIEFWAYSATMDEGETIILWRGAFKPSSGIPVFQEISCRISGQSLMWTFNNFFLADTRTEHTIRLEGKTRLIPRTWHHHLVRFNASTGLVEYLLDGLPEAIAYASKSGREDGTIYHAYIGDAMPVRLSIGDGYTGLLDEVRISTSFVEEPFLAKYHPIVGTAVSNLFDLGYANTRITGITVKENSPPKTAIYFYYYISEKYKTINADDQGWIQFLPEKPFPEAVRGRYIQVMMKLMPDGGGLRAPSVSELTIKYQPDLPPLTPASLWADPGNEQVTLYWDKVQETDVQGYLVFYGERPGYYFGEDAYAGPSPIDAGDTNSFTITGLKNGRAYYFSVVAYDSADPPHRSIYSMEVYARPSHIYSTNTEDAPPAATSANPPTGKTQGSIKTAVPVEGASQ